jgi:hypothetical protein
MMTYIFNSTILLSLIAILFASSCSDNANTTYEFGTEITIQFGETISVGDNGLQFKLNSINEARCPSDVVCVWQGVADVTFNQIQMEAAEEFSLNIMGLCEEDCGENKDVGLYNIELIELNPYPTDANPVTEEDYSAVITVTEI